MPEHGPLVGRCDTIAGIVAATRDERRCAVIVGGPRGVGRTRLARVALATVADGGTGTARPERRWRSGAVMTSPATTDIPLGALAHLLPDLDPALSETAVLLREARRHLAGADRWVLTVDDAHLLDPTSAVLLAQLAWSGNAFLIITVPAGAVAPDPLSALWKDGYAVRLDISVLDRAQCDQLVTSTLGGHVDGATLDRLWQLSLGNPGFVCELVDGARQEGALRRSGMVWRWDPRREPPRRLVEMLTAHVGGLAPTEQDLVRVLAFGQPLGAEVVTTMFPAEVLASLEVKGLVVSGRDGRRLDVRLAHPLYTELLRSRSTPLQERDAYHRLHAAMAASGSRRKGDRHRLLTWRAAEGVATDPEELLEAALAVSDTAPRTAERLLRSAAERGGGAEVALRLGQVRVRVGRFHSAEVAFASAAVLAGTENRPDRDHLVVATTRARNFYWGLQDQAGAEAVADAALAEAATHGTADSPPAQALAAFRALIGEDAGTALDLVAPLIATGDDRDPVTVSALAVAALAHAWGGHGERAVALALRGLDVTRPEADLTGGWLTVELRAAHWYALLTMGRLDAAEDLARRCHREATAAEAGEHVALYLTWLGIVAGRRGKVATAVRRLHEAASGVAARRFPFTVPLVSELAIALACVGRHADARAVLDEAAGSPPTGWPHAAEVWLAGVEGHVSRATELALEDRAPSSAAYHLQALHTVVRLGAGRAVVDALEPLAEASDGPLPALYAEHARALAEDDGSRLDTVAVGFSELGLDLVAAEASAQACAAHRAGGRTGPAAWSAARSRALAEECEGATTPAANLLERSGELTPRESEVASLAASGMTSKAIADQLVISVRTVDNLLRSVYAKLGISRRGDLPAALGLRPV